MWNLLENSDFLGYSYTLKINSQSQNTSKFGGILSLIIIILSLVMVFILGLEIFLKNEPIVLNSYIQNDNFGPYNFSNETNDIEFFVGLEYANFSYYYDESIYTISAEESKVEYVTNLNGTISQILTTRNIKLGRCSEFYTVEGIKKSDLNIPLDLFSCVDPKENVKIAGFWGTIISKSLKVKLEKCVNSTESQIICQSKDTIDKFIQNGVLSMYASDYIIDQKNFEKPTKKFFRDVYNYLSSHDGLIYVIAYGDFKFQTDAGLILQSYDQMKIPMVSEIKNSYSFGQDQIFAFINIQGFKLAQNYLRSYSKIQDILTKVGGLIRALTLIGVGLNYIFSKPFVIINDILQNHKILDLKNKYHEKKFFTIKDLNSINSPVLNDHNVKEISINSRYKKSSKNILSTNTNILSTIKNIPSINKNILSGNKNFISRHKNMISKDFNIFSKDNDNILPKDNDNIFRNYSMIKIQNERKENSFHTKLDLFKSFWCNSHNPQLNKIFKFKEKLINKILSVETLSKINFDVEILKLINYSQNDLQFIDDIHINLFNDAENYQKLRCHLIENNYNFDSSIFSIITSGNKEIKRKLKGFMIEK